MHLTSHTDYALRLLMLLALEPDRLHTIAEIAQRHRVSKNHLMKVALRLTQAGFVSSTRGRGGGLRLARLASDVSLGAVVRATEDAFCIVECFDPATDTCAISKACRLRMVLNEATQAFLNVLDRYSLADMVASPRLAANMKTLLALERTARDVSFS
ncbi:Rrf2 family transcriptional regulator [Sinimarinibacterium sp. CAU 1509]|uniref:RrF2 family transcriptional regulator n=1 Tax=Sinimarinibacterium sp. CAU 1509 TaxID=2562283 RepID=UPI0010ACB9EB|nr:Rrf2 family transcriptional regulator [Sinimarinibacterium sp. CAU 1509]TJY58845.1 Rrf2 family transcriptional regulator [Sinimarinibacterium sp. CAU 1509]